MTLSLNLFGEVLLGHTAGGVENITGVNGWCTFTGSSDWSGEDLERGFGRLSGGCAGFGLVTPPGAWMAVDVSCPSLRYQRDRLAMTVAGVCRIADSTIAIVVDLAGSTTGVVSGVVTTF